MTIILTSRLNYYERDEEGNRTALPLEDVNDIKSNIEKFARNKKTLVYVANNPDNFEENDARSAVMFKSFELTYGKRCFSKKIVLDHRNSSKAKQILQDADVVILVGGKCFCQIRFFNEIDLKSLLNGCQGVVIGISAGTMNLCKTVYNFPEEESDLDEPRWFDGLGFCDDIIIPHFDGESAKYQLEFEGMLDVANDYVLPASKQKNFVALPNESYILIDDNKNKTFYGVSYKISKGKISTLNK